MNLQISHCIKSSENYDEYEKLIAKQNFTSHELGEAHEIFAKFYFESHKNIYDIKHYISYSLDSKKKLEILQTLGLPEKDLGTDAVIIHNDKTISLVQVKWRTKDKSHGRDVFNGLCIDFANCKLEIKNLILFSNVSTISERSFTYDKKFKFVLYETLKSINWNFFKQNISQTTRKNVVLQEINFRQWQKDAINFAKREYKKSRNLTIVAPCGAGKTLCCLGVINSIKNVSKVLIIVPSLQLLSQWFYSFATHKNSKYLLVGSQHEAEDDVTPYCVTTDQKDIEKVLNSNEQVICMSTYQSIKLVTDACKKLNIIFDITISDEAHLTSSSSQSYFTEITKKFPTKLKLFTTATPKVFYGYQKEKTTSMDDEKIYGKKFVYSCKKAIDEGILSEYKIILGLCETIEKGFPNEQKFDIYARLLINCIKKYNLKRILVASNNHTINKMFFDVFESFFNKEKLEHKLILMKRNSNASHKNRALSLISKAPAIIFNVKIFNLGTDIPELDTVFFNGDKNSRIDIVQTAMRCMRKHSSKELAYVIVPAFSGDSLEVEYLGDFPSVRNTLRAMGEQDEELKEEVMLNCKNSNNKNSEKNKKPKKIIYEFIGKILEKVDLGKIKDRIFDRMSNFNDVQNQIKFDIWLKETEKAGEIINETNFIVDNINIGHFQHNLFGRLSDRTDKFKADIENWKKLIETSPARDLINKKIENLKLNRNMRSDPEKKFGLLLEYYKTEGKLYPGEKFSAFNLYSFQLRLFNALINDGSYKEYIKGWKEKLKTLPDVWNEINNQLRKLANSNKKPKDDVWEYVGDDLYIIKKPPKDLKIAKVRDPIGKFNTLIRIYEVLERTISLTHVTNEGIPIGNFQLEVMGCINNNRGTKFAKYLPSWIARLKKLVIWPEIMKKLVLNKTERSPLEY